jgi:hypothetical protein
LAIYFALDLQWAGLAYPRNGPPRWALPAARSAHSEQFRRRSIYFLIAQIYSAQLFQFFVVQQDIGERVLVNLGRVAARRLRVAVDARDL